MERLEDNKRQLEEMKRRTARLEEELRKREANAEEVIKARAEGLIRGERPEPGKRRRKQESSIRRPFPGSSRRPLICRGIRRMTKSPFRILRRVSLARMPEQMFLVQSADVRPGSVR